MKPNAKPTASHDTADLVRRVGQDYPVDGRPATEQIIDLRPTTPSIVGQRFVIDDTHEVHVFGPDHSLVQAIIELEVQQLTDLGDCEDEARDWLMDRTGVAWIALFRRGAEHAAENVLGILRITGPTASNRVLRDLAVLQRSSIDDVEATIAASLGVPTIRPFIDFTTLDITAAGATTRRDRVYNFLRLINALTVASAQMTLRREFRFGLALVHPHLWKHAIRIGMPFHDPGFGVMDYQLSATNTTPMQTQMIAMHMRDVMEAIRGGAHPFMNEVGRTMVRNGLSVDAVADIAARTIPEPV